MNFRITILLNILLLIAGSAFGQFNPTNPEEPGTPVFRYQITTTCTPEGVAWTSGDGEWESGTVVYIHTSRYNDQYTFTNWTWTVGGKEHSSNEQGFDYTMTEEPVTFVAHYKFTPYSPDDPSTVLKSRLYLSSEPEGIATFNRSDGERLEVGSGVWIEAYHNQGYEFKGWYNGNQRISTDECFNFTIPDTETHLVARYVYRPINPPDPDDEGGQEYPEDVQGDLNGDDEVDMSDLKYLEKIVLGKQDEIDAADVNGDARISISDITELIKILREKNK